MTTMTLYTPAGVVAKAAPLRLAARRLQALGFEVTVDEAALARHQRFGGGLLGWIGGGMIPTDPALVERATELLAHVPYGKTLLSAAGAALVVITGKLLAARASKNLPADIPELRP